MTLFETIGLVSGVGFILFPLVTVVVAMTLDAIYGWDVTGEGWLKRWRMLLKDPLCWVNFQKKK